MVKHHVFNKLRGNRVKSQKYRDFFNKHQIDIDFYTLEGAEDFTGRRGGTRTPSPQFWRPS
jgi:hypothetical protein